MTILQVAAGIIVRQGRILLAQRTAGRDYPFTWECPGGKVEPGETHCDALARELLEELGVAADVDDFAVANAVVERLGREPVEVSFWHAAIDRQTPRNVEGQGLGWFTALEMMRLTLAPANEMELGKLIEIVRGSK